MRRAALGATAALLTAVLGTACENEPAPTGSPSAATVKPSRLAPLVVVPAGFVAANDATDPRERSGPFDAASFLATLSAVPHEDKALLLNAGFTEGYHAARTSPDRRKRVTVLLFRAASTAKAQALQRGRWHQDARSTGFAVAGVPGASSDAKVATTGNAGRSAATAEVSFVVGDLVVELRVRELGKTGGDLTPDTALAASLAKLQRSRLAADRP